jgi:predicted CxxxxCH...CXXCH cytochrome family protein
MSASGSLNVAGGKHLDGKVQASGGHGDFTSTAVHAPAFFEFISGTVGALQCTTCHGADYGTPVTTSGDSCNSCHQTAGWTGWTTNCSFCHGLRSPATMAGYTFSAHPIWSAPPDDLNGRLAGTNLPARTGAHPIHMDGTAIGGRSFVCATCHTVPANLSHISGASARAAVVLSGAGQASLPSSLGTYDTANRTCTTYCHGSTLANDAGVTTAPPVWSGGGLACTSCHGYPPVSGMHDLHANMGWWCADCHAGSVTFDGVIGASHLNGARNVEFYSPGSTWSGTDCTSSCHDDSGSRGWH